MNKVTTTIDQWHMQIKKTDFINDEDFVEHQGSPNKFDTTSNFSEAFGQYEININSVSQSRRSSSPRALFQNQSDRDDLSPNSETSHNIINPIKIMPSNDEEIEMINQFNNNETKESDKTADTVKNTQRTTQSKISLNKSKLSDSINKKSVPRNKRSKIRSPIKPSRTKVNVPKQKSITGNMMIKDGLNYSVIEEHIITEDLLGNDTVKDLSISYMTTSKNKQHETMNDSFDIQDISAKKLFTNKHLSNAIVASDYKDKNAKYTRTHTNITGKQSSLSQKQTQP